MLPYGQPDDKSGSFSFLTARRDCAFVTINDFFADGHSNPCSCIFAAAMKPLEGPEDAVEIFLIKADALILDAQFIKAAIEPLTIHPDLWRFMFSFFDK